MHARNERREAEASLQPEERTQMRFGWRFAGWISLTVGVALLVGGCGGSTPSSSPSNTEIATVAPVATPVPIATAATIAPSSTQAGSAASPSGPAFVMTGILPAFPQVVDGSLDPTTFVSSIPDTTPEVFVVYLLGAGINGAIDSTWTDTDTGAAFTHNAAPLAYPGSGLNWEWDSSNVAGGWLPAGHYQVVFTFKPTGEQATVRFTITPTAGESPAATSSSEPPATSTPAGSPGTSPFAVAGLTASLDATLASIDSSAFASSFPADTDTLYAEFALASGLTGDVDISWTPGSGTTSSNSMTYAASDPWAWFGATVAGRFTPGTNSATLTFVATGQTVTLPFTITAPTRSAAASPASAFSLLRMATAADPSATAPDPSTFTDSFPTSATALYVVFELADGLTGTVSCTVSEDGTQVVSPFTVDYGANNSWASLKINASSSGFSAGSYTASLTFEPTGEVATLDFTVQ